MKNFIRSLLAVAAIFGYSMQLAASHHGEHHHDHNNPPCNHESLEDARQAQDHAH